MSTFLGFLAVIFWSTTIGFSRVLTEQLGPITTASAIFLLSGALGCTYVVLLGGGPRKILRLPIPYLFGCGGLFVVYQLCLYLAIGLAASRQQVLEVGMINYLWPGLTLVFSIPVLKKKARLSLVPGVLIAFGGVFLVTAQTGALSWLSFVENLRASATPYALALTAAVSWALYSNLSRRWAGAAEHGGVPVFLLLAGLTLTALRLLFPEEPHWEARTALGVLYMAIVPALLAYVFWDQAMRKGKMILVASFSYLTPLFSTVLSCLYLRVFPGANLWVGCALVIGGAVICKYSIAEQ